MSFELPLGEYIFRRLRNIGIGHIFGVPGDFNLNLIDHVDSVNGLEWIGTCNELNASYAADGYARARGLPGVLVTTYGVGEMSAINGVSGAYAEVLPVIHIVGTTSRAAQQATLMLHHTLGEGIDHGVYGESSKHFRADAAYLLDDETFTKDVDRVIEVAYKTRLPVYIFIPSDVPDLLVDASRLNTPLDLTICNPGKEAVEDEIVTSIMALLQKARKPSFLVDLLVRRFGLTEHIREMVKLTGFPGFVTPLGKSLIDETDENFGGLYLGPITPDPETAEAIESSDVVVYVGRYPSDCNTGGFRQNLAEDGTLIILHSKYVTIGNKRYEDISFVPIVQKLLVQLHESGASLKRNAWKVTRNLPPVLNPHGHIKQSGFWPSFSPFFRKNDCIVAEVGTSQFAFLNMPLAANCDFHSQLFYGCIGYTVGGVLGILAARREMNTPGRVILFIGDGSLQMTVQEISTIIHNGFKPMIVVLNNAGYTIERVIHGPARKYNSIAPWDFQKLLPLFGAAPGKSASYHVGTFDQLRNVLGDPRVSACDRIQLVECIMDKYDAPEILTTMIDASSAFASMMLEESDEANGRRRVRLDGTLTESGLSTSDHGEPRPTL
ncbi:hypothetical protein KEM56_002153 [Ascosphaera pollenicola]|nr:hypothetical protein KEM56_002153 [Ascosphaera pollenicola]